MSSPEDEFDLSSTNVNIFFTRDIYSLIHLQCVVEKNGSMFELIFDVHIVKTLRRSKYNVIYVIIIKTIGENKNPSGFVFICIREIVFDLRSRWIFFMRRFIDKIDERYFHKRQNQREGDTVFPLCNNK